MKKNKKISIYIIKKIIIFLPVIMGSILILIMIISILYTGKMNLDEDIENYEDTVDNIIIDDVENAVKMTELYYEDNKDRLSEEELIDGIIERIGALESIQDGTDFVGYYFIGDYDGNIIFGLGEGENLYYAQDKDGNYFVQEFISAAQNGGSTLTFNFPELDETEDDYRTSYVLAFEPYNWFIGEEVHISKIDDMKSKFIQNILKQSLIIILFFGSSIIIIMFILRKVLNKIFIKFYSDLNTLNMYLDSSAENASCLLTDGFQIKELEQIGQHTSELVVKQYESLDLLMESEKRFSSIVNTLPDAIFIINKNGEFIDYTLGDKSGIQKSEIDYIGENLSDFFPEDITAKFFEKIELALVNDDLQILEYDLKTDNETESYEVRLLKFKENQVFSIIRNTTELKKIQREYEYLSFHDQLTSVYNRRYFEEEIVHIDIEKNLPISFAMIDLNGLKLTNDAFGHQTGDEMLKIVANVLSDTCMENDFIARIGGDEFAMVSTNTSYEVMDKKIKLIYEKVEGQKTKEAVLSISIGFDTKLNSNQKMIEIVKKAEEKMYSKKISESQSMRNQTVQVIMKTLNEKNEREKIHSERVGIICRMIGEAMDLDSIAIKELETAGLLHDIGKISIKDKILNKEGSLTDEEYKEIKKHPESSYQILKTINEYAGLAEAVLSHHERWDGKGYPRGIEKYEISLNARIIAVADSYEAMTANRSYREAISNEKAMDELRNNAGIQFDPEIIKIFEEKVYNKL